MAAHLQTFFSLPKKVCVREIRINSYELPYYNLPNYEFCALQNDCYASGGVGLFIHDTLKYNFRPLEFPSYDLVLVYITDFVLSTKLNLCMTVLRSLNTMGKTVIVLGDFNLDLFASGSFVDSYHLMCSSNDFISTINKPTRMTYESCRNSLPIYQVHGITNLKRLNHA